MLNLTRMAEILVVDDDALVHDYLMQVLTHDGHQVTAVYSGEEALSAIADQEFAVAFVDLKMMGIGGMEVVEAIRRQHPATVVIVLTGHPSLESIFEAMKQGAYDYLFKPCRINELRETLRKGLMQRRRLLRSGAISSQSE